MTHPIRLGQIPYLNCVLFFHAVEGQPGFHLLPLVPSALSGAAADGAVDAGPVPLVDTWEIEDTFMPLGDFCISTIGRARSVLLFSRQPFDRLDGAQIGITNESSTSVRLLKVMLSQVWRVRPARFVRVDERQNDAFLLIGDDALRHRRGTADHPHVADLGEVWNQWTGLPFVFARWMVHRDLADAARQNLCDTLERSLADGWNQIDRIAAPRASALNMSIDEVREYLHGFRFRATAAEEEAMRKFRELDAMVREAPHAPLAQGKAK